MMPLYRVLGIMTGTSLDGIDLAILETDGLNQITVKETAQFDFPTDLRGLLQASVMRALAHGYPIQDPIIDNASRILADLCADKAEFLIKKVGKVDLIGFHGQTLLHAPDRGVTWQIGDAQRMADRLGIPVIHDFRTHDVKQGGQGAPLVPVYHAALLEKANIHRPAMIVNLGGVANMTWVHGQEIHAFDTGPANGLLDMWVQQEAGVPYDRDGALASMGDIDTTAFTAMVMHPFFSKVPPKSMDRHDMNLESVQGLSVADGAVTLTAVTAWSLRHAMAYVPHMPEVIFLAGGGKHNKTLVSMIQTSFPEAEFMPLSVLGSDADTLEAEAFAYLAVRSYKGLPISFPTTTGVTTPQTGGNLVQPQFAQETCI